MVFPEATIRPWDTLRRYFSSPEHRIRDKSRVLQAKLTDEQVLMHSGTKYSVQTDPLEHVLTETFEPTEFSIQGPLYLPDVGIMQLGVLKTNIHTAITQLHGKDIQTNSLATYVQAIPDRYTSVRNEYAMDMLYAYMLLEETYDFRYAQSTPDEYRLALGYVMGNQICQLRDLYQGVCALPN